MMKCISLARRLTATLLLIMTWGLLAACAPTQPDSGGTFPEKIMQPTASATSSDDDDDGVSLETLTPTHTWTPSTTFTATHTFTPSATFTPTHTYTATATPMPSATATPTSTRLPGTGGTIFVIEGPVVAININIITIYDVDIAIDPASPVLPVIRIGDVIRVSGERFEDDDDDDDGGRTVINIVSVTIIFISVDVVIIDGQVWRDLGDCAGIPAFVTRENARRYFARCIDNRGGGNPGGGGSQGGGRGDNDDDDDDDD
jgi:hypothetical protein